MNYLPTPFNISSVFLVIIAIYSYTTSPEGGDGLQNFWVIPMIGVAIILLVVDYFFQKHFNSFKGLLMIEFFIVVCLYFLPKVLFFLK